MRNDPTWSYGESRLFNSFGPDTDPDNTWVYGENELIHELFYPVGIYRFIAEHSDTHFIADALSSHFVAEHTDTHFIAEVCC